MRIVVDLQGAQSTANRNRGIGRYSMSLCRALVRNRGEHEIILVLSELCLEAVDSVRQAFADLLPRENIRLWTAPGPVSGKDPANDWRRGAAQLVRETFLASLDPDFVLVTSLFEGLGDDAVTSVGVLPDGPPTAVVLFDLIPLIHRSPYLDSPDVSRWYFEKIDHLQRADLCLTISESSRREGREYLGMSAERCVSISTDAEPHFRPIEIPIERERELRVRYGLDRPFLMYTGGIDHRKNIEGLISAYAALPCTVRDAHRLAIVCSVHEVDRERLDAHALEAGLAPGTVVMTGFVPEDELLALYNMCSAFVFPSWHEGFGLPVLEAMRCGAPVIGADRSSVPEVIGLEEALFNPHSQVAMTAAIQRVLTDEAFRARLRSHGVIQARRFSWDRSARTAIAAMEHLNETRRNAPRGRLTTEGEERPRLAFVSPLPPARSGIADYSVELLRVLRKHYRIDVIVKQEAVSDAWIRRNFAVRSPEWLVAQARRYDRVLYHFGNSEFHQHMFDLLEKVPGIVVLHDFFLSGLIAHMDVTGVMPHQWSRELYRSHGYPALRDRFVAADTADVVWAYPCSASVVQNSIGVIVHSPSTVELARRWYGPLRNQWEVVPLLREPSVKRSKAAARRKLGFGPNDFVVCTLGKIGPMKQSLRLLNAWEHSSLSNDSRCHLIFVGENDAGEYGAAFDAAVRAAQSPSHVRITGWVDEDIFKDYRTASDLAVQLRTLSRGETSAAVLDCMNHGLPTIVNANGSMADLDEAAVWKLQDQFTDDELVEAFEYLRDHSALRERLSAVARKKIRTVHDPKKCAGLYRDIIEKFYSCDNLSWRKLPDKIAQLPGLPVNFQDLVQTSSAIGQSFPATPRISQILIDISWLVHVDSGTGIQRVVRNILRRWLSCSMREFRIEPVYSSEHGQYRYARKFTSRFLKFPDDILEDEIVEFAQGDIFLGLDLHLQVVAAHADYYRKLRRAGVRVIFAVYDLLCVRMPQHFSPGAYDAFSRWLQVIVEADAAICISQAVANDLKDWVGENAEHSSKKLSIASFQLGADLDLSTEECGAPKRGDGVVRDSSYAPTFLMVGTLEPRKGHRQVLAAFESFWRNGSDVRLIVVGKSGWLMDDFAEKLRELQLSENRLVWHENVPDEHLDRIYASSDCLVAASEGEGFGLPLIEAARHGLPIIARDIAVFREVAQDNAYYFRSNNENNLAEAIEDWIALFREGLHPKSDNITWSSWDKSAEQLMQLVIKPNNAIDSYR